MDSGGVRELPVRVAAARAYILMRLVLPLVHFFTYHLAMLLHTIKTW